MERLKELVDAAIAYGRKAQSPQTKFVHYHYHAEEHEPQHTIPVLENALFALALLRSRTVENVTEAKGLLEKLLAFQSHGLEESEGHFPLYLHEYPLCHDRSLGIRLLAPFYWILKHFGHVLGATLKQNLEKVTEQVLSYGQKTHAWKPVSYGNQVRLAAGLQAFGKLFQQIEMEQQGEKWLRELSDSSFKEEWYSTACITDILVGLQMSMPIISESTWSPFFDHLALTWHPSCGAYVGPCIKEFQVQHEPQPTLYDLFLGYFTNSKTKRTERSQPYHLHAALIQPLKEAFPDSSGSQVVESNSRSLSWQLSKQGQNAGVILEKRGELHPSIEKTYTYFRYLWGDLSYAHSFVCQGGRITTLQGELKESSFDLLIELDEPLEVDEKEKQKELSFYFDVQDECQLRVGGLPSTTFELDQVVEIVAGQRRFNLTFSLLEGEGIFLGHFIRGNRPSQIDLKGEKRFDSYDWQVFLRTVRRKEKCRLKVTIEVENVEPI